MTSIEYPWRWLTDGVGATFGLRYPWVDEVARAVRRLEQVCVLIPEAAGSLSSWAGWLGELIGRDPSATHHCASGDFVEITRQLAEAYQVEDVHDTERPDDRARVFLAACRRTMPHVEPVPLVAVEPDDDCATALGKLVQVQRALGYPFVRPVLLRRTRPPDWSAEVVRFGLPEPVGDLHRIAPSPERDLVFWTNLVIALVVTWEAGAVPQLADELWEQLRVAPGPTLRDANFDLWLEHKLNEFAVANLATQGTSLPDRLAFSPLDEVADELWQLGAVAWQDERFDVTPLRARLWIHSLEEAGREALRRRRLTNAPLARWLSAWASSIEESLRIAVLQVGGSRFRTYLRGQPPRNRRGAEANNRWDELAPADEVSAVDTADFGDLAGFVAQLPFEKRGRQSLATLLDQCRLARNRVVHQRRLSASDLLRISGVVDWLSEQGLIS